ncbi:hypothetical protein, partial [Bernardetia sp.]|uniref:hypothetical protein n=1 Tax=Bernardetia sp. TaxID=1937974 RepID=UPI0025C6EEAE
PTTENSFSNLKNTRDELKKYILVKHRTEIVNLLPNGTAEELAEKFAEWWVGQERDFTHTPKQRIWVKNSLPKWAEIEKPKNATSNIRKIVQQAWKKELTEKETQLVSEKIASGIDKEELLQILYWSKSNLGPEQRKNIWFVFGKNFESIREWSKEAVA